MTLQIQFATLLLMAACGLGLGVSFDVVGTVMQELRARRWIRAVLDLLYWAAATLIVFRVLLYANNGQVRAFVFVGLALGVLAYALLFGKLVRRLTGAAIRLVRRIVNLVLRIFRAVVWRPLSALYRLIAGAAGYLLNASVFTGKIMVQWIKPAYGWIRRRFRRD